MSEHSLFQNNGNIESKENSKYQEGEVCASKVNFLDLMNGKFTVQRELHDLSSGELISARSTNLLLPYPGEARIDIRVKQADGSAKYYEEYPTPLSSPIPMFAKIAGPIYDWDPISKERGKTPLEHNSGEYQEAYKALTWLRETYTPGKILFGGIPDCKKR